MSPLWRHSNACLANLLALLLAVLSTAGPAQAQTASPSPQMPAAGSANPTESRPAIAKPEAQKNSRAVPNTPASPTKPLWSELSLPQQQALSPLASEWDKLDATQKQKWLVISTKYASLKPDQQIRLQERIRDWVKLTPDQRRAARENYSKAKQLDPSRKSAQWEQYQQLPEETKRKLAAEATARNRVANLPSPSENKNRITPPKKEGQVKPQATPAQPQPSPPAPAASPEEVPAADDLPLPSP